MLTMTHLILKSMASIQIILFNVVVQIWQSWKIRQSFVSTSSLENDFGNPRISRLSLLEHWTFHQHCLSVSTNRGDNKEFASLVTATSITSLENVLFMIFSSSKFLALETSILLSRSKAIAVKSSLLSFLKDSFGKEVILENSCSESKRWCPKQITHLHTNLA